MSSANANMSDIFRTCLKLCQFQTCVSLAIIPHLLNSKLAVSEDHFCKYDRLYEKHWVMEMIHMAKISKKKLVATNIIHVLANFLDCGYYFFSNLQTGVVEVTNWWHQILSGETSLDLKQVVSPDHTKIKHLLTLLKWNSNWTELNW